MDKVFVADDIQNLAEGRWIFLVVYAEAVTTWKLLAFSKLLRYQLWVLTNFCECDNKRSF